jgi:integrase
VPAKPRLHGDKDRLLLLTDQDRLLDFLDRHADAGWEPTRRAVLLILQTGLRVSEACNLLIADCDVRSRPYRVLVRGGKKRDREHVDEIIIPEALAVEIRVWCADRPADAPVLARQTVFPYTRQHLWRCIKEAYTEVGLHDKFGVHTLRHRFITTTYQQTNDIIFTQRQARHRSLDQTSAYVHLASMEGDMLEAVDAVGVGGARKKRSRGSSPRRATDAKIGIAQATRRKKGGRR